ncbi:LPXTG cell wall anchor domain-containing protein [Enterococcus sp. CWB-B31]|uniref:LPXTG cell wall anchor domain-containing protein n=1 Tax=Enterococcus sp. CWB-B31 TaxID=2885159 RepID=UPI001E2C9E81|nr:LPXTG cell wall anchor domain-containing protein [Enterococcus sp. CWB-B31]MCB5956327.1 LPXTG cell wall anchor domain-containing protein [Enterococcus sp. CWB-B31]
MGKKSFALLVASFIAVLSIFSGGSMKAMASGNGGSVQTNGVITFYDETVTSSSTEPANSSTTSSSMASSSTLPATDGSSTVGKPTGTYPSTGELVKTGLSFSGIAIVAAVLFFFWIKRKEQGKRKGSR